MKARNYSIIASSLVALSMLSACSGGKAETAVKPAAKEELKPVTIKIYQWTPFTDEQWQQLFVEPVKKKYPHITLEQIVRGKGTNPEELVASGAFPDIYVAGDLKQYKALGLTMDITQLAKKESIDLSKFDPSQLDRSKLNGELLTLPFSMTYGVMFYNKDIFDKMAIPYPKDGMTWEDTVALAKQVTRQIDGVQYKGMHPQTFFAVKDGLPIDILDPKTDLASLDNDSWRNVISLYKDLVTIPGNEPKGSAFADASNAFIKDRHTAMIISNVMASMGEATQAGLNWDIVQPPSHKSSGYNSGGATTAFGVSKTTKSPDDAMKVISVLVSEEVQTLAAKKFAFYPSLVSKPVIDSFGGDVPYLKDKNVKGLFKGKTAPYMETSQYSSQADVRKIFNDKLNEVVAGKKDVNTMIREATDEINKKMPQIKAK